MSTFARMFGYGTDPAGDAARREAMAHATISPDELAAIRQVGQMPEELRARIAAAVRHDLRARADRIVADARRQMPRGPVPEVDDPGVDGHRLTHTRGGAGTEVVCECGRWEGWYNGPRSRRRVLDDYARHAAAELAAEGPIKVVAVRLDLPEELEP